jgi:hypothetical protein
MLRQKRAAKRKLNPKPDVPAEGCDAAREAIACTKTTLNRFVRPENEDFQQLLERTVLAINQMTKRVSMLAKELLLTMLEHGSPLPALDQTFFAGLYVSMWRGRWVHGWDHILARHRTSKADGVSGTVMSQAMATVAIRLSAAVDTHIGQHYDAFYCKWKRSTNFQGDINAHHLDATVAETNVLLRSMWKMRRDMEDAEGRGFALFPETSSKVSYVTLDGTCITQLFKQLHPEACRTADGHAKSAGTLLFEDGERIFNSIFFLDRVRALRSNHFFRFSVATDGFGVSWSFGRWIHYDTKKSDELQRKRGRKSKAQKTPCATTVAVQNLVPGYAYTAKNKTLDSFDDLEGITVRCVDPGVHRTFTSVDLLTGENDVRKSVQWMRGASWTAMTASKSVGAAQKKRHESSLGEVQREKNSVPFRTSSYSQRYAAYVDMELSHWDATWAFYVARRMRKCRFAQGRRSQSVLDQTVNRLCAPRPGDTRTLLVYGNAATTNSFGKIRGNVKGPAKKLFDMALRDKKATTVWADEFRTSKLDIYGHDSIHPPERRRDRLVPAPCKSQAHGEGAPGCKHLCAQAGCNQVRSRKAWCFRHFEAKKITQHDVCYHHSEQHGHRMWNRDVMAAINIGCLFLARAMGREVGLWERGTSVENNATLSWAEIFVDIGTPFSIPAAALPS